MSKFEEYMEKIKTRKQKADPEIAAGEFLVIDHGLDAENQYEIKSKTVKGLKSVGVYKKWSDVKKSPFNVMRKHIKKAS